MSELGEPDLDPDSLHEVYPDAAVVRARIGELRAQVRTAPDEVAELLARGELVALLRTIGELDEALAQGRGAADRAEMVGNPPQRHLARLRLASVHQWRGEFGESNLLFTELEAVGGQFGPVIEAFTLSGAGRNAYEQGHYAEAREYFARALGIRERFGLPDDQIATSRQSLAAARRRLGPDE